MIKKTDLIFGKTGIFSDRQFYLIGDIALLMGHIGYLILFHWLGIYELQRYNYFSIFFYALMLVLIYKTTNRSPFIMLMILEIMCHAVLSTLYLGWSAGFGQFMLCIISIPFYLSIKNKLIPYLLSALDIAIFIKLKILTNEYKSIYTLNEKTTNLVYAINSILSSVIIIYMASNYIFTKNAVQKQMEEKNEELEKLATIDPLTSLFNRRAMMDFLKIIQEQSVKTNTSYVIALGDVDDFKNVNDSFGHSAGDEALKIISEIITHNVPSEGYVCRWGGEEILFAIPSADMEKGMNVSKKIVQEVSAYEFSFEENKFNISLTIGVSQVDAGMNFENGIKIADNRLYQGKSCVIGNKTVKI